jgi:plasmid stability protein
MIAYTCASCGRTVEAERRLLMQDADGEEVPTCAECAATALVAAMDDADLDAETESQRLERLRLEADLANTLRRETWD